MWLRLVFSGGKPGAVTRLQKLKESEGSPEFPIRTSHGVWSCRHSYFTILSPECWHLNTCLLFLAAQFVVLHCGSPVKQTCIPDFLWEHISLKTKCYKGHLESGVHRNVQCLIQLEHSTLQIQCNLKHCLHGKPELHSNRSDSALLGSTLADMEIDVNFVRRCLLHSIVCSRVEEQTLTPPTFNGHLLWIYRWYMVVNYTGSRFTVQWRMRGPGVLQRQ